MGSRHDVSSPDATCKADIWEPAPPLRNPWSACDELESLSFRYAPVPADSEPYLGTLANDIKREMATLNDMLLKYKAVAASQEDDDDEEEEEEDDYDPFELDYSYPDSEPAATTVLPMDEFWDLVDDIRDKNRHAPGVMSPLNPLRAKAPPDFWWESGALSPLPEKRKYHWNIERVHVNETLAIPSPLFRRYTFIKQCRSCWQSRFEQSSLQRYIQGRNLRAKYLKCVGRRDEPEGRERGYGVSVAESPLMHLVQMGT
ncbi:uncharacterized protein EV420DRAFT_97215 [Desarmillaria tabescens]|uniref:Uncharacterized protein n=1 Tax=Armillaria tabescens TaxID=1929756 RepID=A0AA39NRC6_ARMTA|nr:uncharacterized protein EV420DRAFT_97215 [Desarmillaria tabescens]KAK0470209.1 hypothetical protein EV420DRAFT_97215 [Desarmillaria tabescens]